MKKLFIFALLYLTPSAFAQGISYSNSVTRSGGFPFATVRVCNEPASGTPCTPLASIFYDPGLTLPIIQPFSADANGNFSFFGAPSTIAVPSTMYHIQITGNGISSYDIGYVFLAGGGGGGGSSLWSALGTPTSNLALSFGTYTTTFTSGDFGASPVPAVLLHTTTSTSATDTSYELGCDVATSYHNCMYAKIGGFMQFQVANIGGAAHLGTIVMGSALAPANLTTAYGSKAWILSSTPAYNPLTLYHLSTSETGSLLRMHSASASGGAFDFLTACTNASISDGSCSSGNNVYRVHSDGSTYQSGSGNFGATPPTCCNSIFGAAAFNEAGVAGTPTVGQDYCRADSTTHSLKCSYNGAAEAKLPLVSTINTWTAANSFPTVTFPESSTVGTPTTGQDYCRGDSTKHARKCSDNGGAEYLSQPAVALIVGTGISTWGAGDIGSQVNTALAALPGSCGEISILPGSYTQTTIIGPVPRCVKLHGASGYGTLLNYSTAWSVILADAFPSTIFPEGALEDIALIGPGTGTSTGGVYVGGSDGQTGSPSTGLDPGTNYGNFVNINRVLVFYTGTCIQFGNNAYDVTMFESFFTNCGTGSGIYFPTGVTNSGENINLVSSGVLNGSGIGVRIGNNGNMDFRCTNSSIDFNTSWQVQNGTTSGNQRVSMDGCHIESTDHWMQNFGIVTVTNSEFNNGTLSGTLGYLIDNEGVALNVFGGTCFNAGSGQINNPAGLASVWIAPTCSGPALNNTSFYMDRFGNSYTTVGRTVQGPFGSTAVLQTYGSCETAGAPTTVNTGGTATNTGLNCLPANSVIDSITYRITTAITTSASFTIGDSGSATRYGTCYFSGGAQVLTLGATGVCNAGYYQNGGTALPVKLTFNANPGAGAIRLTVYYHTWTPPTS